MRNSYIVLYRIGRKKIALGYPAGFAKRDAENMAKFLVKFKPEAKDIAVYKKNGSLKRYAPPFRIKR